jgi:hypothetical protein
MLEISDNDRQRILAIIAERLHNYTMLWKTKDFSQLPDADWGANRDMLMRPDYDLYIRLGGDPNNQMLTIFRGYWSL